MASLPHSHHSRGRKEVSSCARRKGGRLGRPGKGPGEGRLRKAAGAVLPTQGRVSPLGREAGDSRSERHRAEALRGDARTHQIWNLSSGPVAYCIFNLLLGTPPRLAETSLRTSADAATRSNSKSFIFPEPATSAALRLSLQPTKAQREPGAGSRAHSAGAVRQIRGGRQECACAARFLRMRPDGE